MEFSPELTELFSRFKQELDQIESEAEEGLSILRSLIARGDFSDDSSLVRLYATLNNALFFVEISRRRIDNTLSDLRDESLETLRFVGEDLSELLGQVLETKLEVSLVVSSLTHL